MRGAACVASTTQHAAASATAGLGAPLGATARRGRTCERTLDLHVRAAVIASSTRCRMLPTAALAVDCAACADAATSNTYLMPTPIAPATIPAADTATALAAALACSGVATGGGRMGGRPMLTAITVAACRPRGGPLPLQTCRLARLLLPLPPLPLRLVGLLARHRAARLPLGRRERRRLGTKDPLEALEEACTLEGLSLRGRAR